jgi:hypothetical protein
METYEKIMVTEVILFCICIAVLYYLLKDIKITVTKHKRKDTYVEP